MPVVRQAINNLHILDDHTGDSMNRSFWIFLSGYVGYCAQAMSTPRLLIHMDYLTPAWSWLSVVGIIYLLWRYISITRTAWVWMIDCTLQIPFYAYQNQSMVQRVNSAERIISSHYLFGFFVLFFIISQVHRPYIAIVTLVPVWHRKLECGQFT